MIPADGSHKPLIHTRGQSPLSDQMPLNGNHTQTALVPLPITPGTAAAPSLGALIVALKRRWLLALTLALGASVGVVAGLAYLFPAKYMTQARLELASRGGKPLFSVGADQEVDPAIYRANQQAIIQSPLVLSHALNSDKLKGTPISGESPDALERAMKVDFSKGPEIMTIKLTGDDPENLAKTLEAIIESYIDEAKTRDNRRRTLLIGELERSLIESQNKLDSRRKELRKAEIDNKIPDAILHPPQFQALSSKLFGIESNLRKTQDDLSEKLAALDDKNARLKIVDKEPLPDHKLNLMLSTHLQVQQYYSDYAKLGTDIAKYSTFPESPLRDAELKRLREQQDAVKKDMKDSEEALRPALEVKYRAELRETLEQEIRSLEGSVRAHEQREKSLTDQLQKAQTDIEILNNASRKPGSIIEKLRDDVKQIEKTQEKLAHDVALLRLEPAISSKIIMLKSPETPTSKDYSQLTRLGTAGGLGTFLLVLFGVAFMEFKSRKVNAPGEVTQELGLTLVGTMPKLPSRLQRTVHSASSPLAVQWQSIITESIDAIRTQLLHAARTDAVQVVMVTSAVGGEGKTSLSSQLAASLARAWRKTLLVDGDLRNPAAHRLFNVQLEPGFSEVLRGETSASDAVKPTTLSRLWVLPAGHWDAHAVQALAQEGVRTTFDQLKEQYDFIIVDSCPVLPVADSLLLGQHVDAVIFSVLRDVSRLPSVKSAQQKLQGLGVRMLGAVVIGAESDPGSLIYRYTNAGS